MIPAIREPGRRLLPLIFAFVAGCNAISLPTGNADELLASVINVTPFEIEVTVSGVLDARVDTVTRTVAASGSAEIPFVCVDEVVVGDPLAPAQPGIIAHIDGVNVEIAPFTILGSESFFCGDILEVIVSGTDADTLAVDVFALTPP